MTGRPYNYAVFDITAEEQHFESFFTRLHSGERAPGGNVEDLESGDAVGLDSLWATGLAVLEFGSFT